MQVGPGWSRAGAAGVTTTGGDPHPTHPVDSLPGVIHRPQRAARVRQAPRRHGGSHCELGVRMTAGGSAFRQTMRSRAFRPLPPRGERASALLRPASSTFHCQRGTEQMVVSGNARSSQCRAGGLRAEATRGVNASRLASHRVSPREAPQQMRAQTRGPPPSSRELARGMPVAHAANIIIARESRGDLNFMRMSGVRSACIALRRVAAPRHAASAN